MVYGLSLLPSHCKKSVIHCKEISPVCWRPGPLTSLISAVLENSGLLVERIRALTEVYITVTLEKIISCWKLKVLVAQLCPTLCNPMGCSLPGSSNHGILQARILE